MKILELCAICKLSYFIFRIFWAKTKSWREFLHHKFVYIVKIAISIIIGLEYKHQMHSESFAEDYCSTLVSNDSFCYSSLRK